MDNETATNNKQEFVTFDKAVIALKEGKRVGFKYWDEDTFIFMQVPAEIPYSVIPNMQSLPQSVKDELKRRYENSSIPYQETFSIRYSGQVAMMLPDGRVKGYSFSPAKVLSDDWIILD
jgi:hypothetical protein